VSGKFLLKELTWNYLEFTECGYQADSEGFQGGAGI
jgi:hypothetical protein